MSQDYEHSLVLNDKKVIRAWALFDWANSAYSLVISTAIFPIYFLAVAPDPIEAVLRKGSCTFEPTRLYGITNYDILELIPVGLRSNDKGKNRRSPRKGSIEARRNTHFMAAQSLLGLASSSEEENPGHSKTFQAVYQKQKVEICAGCSAIQDPTTTWRRETLQM